MSALIWVDRRPPRPQAAFPPSLSRQLGASHVLELSAASVAALGGHDHAAGAALAQRWQARHPGKATPLLIGVGLASRALLAGLAEQFRCGSCLLLDQNAEGQQLGDLVAVLASATRIVTTDPAICSSWEQLLQQEWDAEFELPKQWQQASSPRQLLSVALEARELGRATWQQLSQQAIPLAWNRAHLAYGKLAPQLQADPVAQNLAVNVALAGSGFQPRWLSPRKACEETTALLLRCGASTHSAAAKHTLQLLPHQLAPAPGPLPAYAVHLHAYHLQESAVILARLAQMSHPPGQLILTGPNPQQLQQQLAPQLRRFPTTRIELIGVPNRGRNIGALITIADRLQYQWLLHLHGKDTSPQDPSHFIHHWLEFLISSLFSRLPATLQALQAGGHAAAFPADPHRRQLGSNTEALQQLLAQHPRVQLRRRDAFVFPLGMMLWLESGFLLEQLKPLYAALDPRTLSEPLAANGTPLHALERAIPLLAALQQRRLLLIEPPQGLSR